METHPPPIFGPSPAGGAQTARCYVMGAGTRGRPIGSPRLGEKPALREIIIKLVFFELWV
jgi:hypothetical protein